MMWFMILVLVVVGAFGFWRWSKRRLRKSMLAARLSNHEWAVIADQVPMTRKLPPDLRDKLEGKVNLFLHQVDFVGCNGLEVTEEMELSIAAQACILIANTDTWYEKLHTILIYPGAFKSRMTQRSGYVLTERETVRTGESWSRGPVVLSWQHTKEGAYDDQDGHNVVFHEFAHQIDDLSGQTNGIPILSKDQKFTEWADAFVAAYDRHVHSVQTGHRTVIDPYGAEGPEEFFAVSVEVFFEQPAALKQSEPAVYEQLSKLFQLKPETW